MAKKWYQFFKKSLPDVPITPVTIGNQTWYIRGLNGFSVTGSVDTTTKLGQRDAYLRCPAVATVINKKIQAALNGRMMFVNKNGDEVQTGSAQKYYDLLNNPNPLQDWSSFYSMAKTMQQVFGKCYFYAVKPAGFGFESTKQLYVLPNWLVDIEYETGAQYISFTDAKQIKQYTFNYNGTTAELAPEDVIVWNDQMLDLSNTMSFYSGGSRLIPLMDSVNTIIAAYEGQEQLLTSAGAIGILSNAAKDATGTIPVTPDQKKEIQDKYSSEYGLQRDKSKVLITDATLSWQAMSRPTRELMLLESIEDSTRSITDAYNYPMYLLGFKGGSTFNNVGEAKKSLYSETTIPEQQSFSDLFTRIFKLNRTGIWLKFDYSEVDAMQQSEAEKAQAMQAVATTYSTAYNDGVVTMEEYRAALDLDAKPNGKTFKTPQQ